MSASLVGSEMCIRDRFSSRVSSTVFRPFLHLPVPADRRSPLELSHELPVSYTHLTLPTICSV
eukprot:8387528-Alexandrium_andersonii.AAC.1